MLKNQDFDASAEDPMKLAKTKGSNNASESRFCCLRRRPNETDQNQRQQSRLKKQDFAASAEDLMNPASDKGSKHAQKSRF